METLEMTLRRDSLREKPKYKVKKVKNKKRTNKNYGNIILPQFSGKQ